MRTSRDSLAAILATAAFVLVVILGFWKTRGPSAQRLIRTDERRIQNMSQLANEINNLYRQHDKQLPVGLSDAQKRHYTDPVTGKPLEYTPRPPSDYTLCTSFSAGSPKDEPNGTFGFWTHPSGPKCFEFNATEQVPQAPYFYY
jgi:hypothetical protein